MLSSMASPTNTIARTPDASLPPHIGQHLADLRVAAEQLMRPISAASLAVSVIHGVARHSLKPRK